MCFKNFILLSLCLLVKLSFSQGGNFIWADSLPASKLFERIVANDAAGNVFICGRFDNTPDLDPGPSVFTLSASSGNVFVLKLDGSGNFIWAKNFGNAIVGSYTVDGAGNSFITGSIQATCDFDPGPGTYSLPVIGNFNGFINKLDPAGNFLWAKSFEGSASNNITELSLDQSGNIYFTGYFDGTIDLDPGPSSYTLSSYGATDIDIVKLDASGNFIWGKRVGGNSFDFGINILSNLPNTCIISGVFYDNIDLDPGPGTYTFGDSPGSQNSFILKLDAVGNFVSGGELRGNSYIASAATNVDGSLLIGGAVTGTMDADPGPGISLVTGIGTGDGFILKLDNSLNLIWAKTFSCSSSNDRTYPLIRINASGEIFAYGPYKGIVDFDPGPAVLNYTSTGSTDIFMMQLNVSGELQWVKSIGTPTTDYERSFSLNQNSELFVTGQYAGTIDLDPGPGTFTLFTPGDGSGPAWGNYILKLGSEQVSIAENNLQKNAPVVYPVPVKNKLFIKHFCADKASVCIYNSTGQELISQTQFDSSGGIDISALSPDIYSVLVKCNDISYAIKVIKE